MNTHRRHDISDKLWENLEPHLPGKRGFVGRPAADNRLYINGVFWILRTGAPWRDLPSDYGHWKNVHRRFYRWRGIATRYAKNTASFLAAIHIRCIHLWGNLI